MTKAGRRTRQTDFCSERSQPKFATELRGRHQTSMAMGQTAPAICLLAFLAYIVVHLSDAASYELSSSSFKIKGNDAARSRRQSDNEDDQFCCWFPWNETMVHSYVNCGLLDRRQRLPFGVPVYSDAGDPNFSEAKYCSVNATQQPGTGDPSPSNPTPSDSDEEGSWCTDGPSDDCRVKCVYNISGVLNAAGRPDKGKLFVHWFKRLNSLKGFKLHIRNAVNLCLSLHDQTIRDYGSSNIDVCVLQSQVHYCIEEVVGRFCPRRFRKRMLIDEVCEET